MLMQIKNLLRKYWCSQYPYRIGIKKWRIVSGQVGVSPKKRDITDAIRCCDVKP